MESVRPLRESDRLPVTFHEYVVLGAGPAGLQAAYYLERDGRDYLVLEAAEGPGAFFKTFPRHRRLISINKVSTGFDDPEVNLRWDWNSLLTGGAEPRFTCYSKKYFPHADAMVDYLRDFASRFELKIRYGVRVARVSRDGAGRDGLFVLRSESGEELRCRTLLVATGVARPYVPEIPGIELAEGYAEVSIDPEDFRGQRVMVIGKGNSGFETADNLVETAAAIHIASPEPIRLAWRTHYVGHLRACNNNLLDTYQLKSQNTILDADVTAIRRGEKGLLVDIAYRHADGQCITIPVDRVIHCTGFHCDASIFDESCKPELVFDGKLPAVTSEWESTSVPDLFFAGALMQARDYQKAFSAFIHGFRYNVKALCRMLAQRYHGEVWPSATLSAEPAAICQAFLRRIHGNSALFQQPGFFCDVLALEGEEAKAARYWEDVPMDYAHEGRLGRFDSYYTLSLEYGHDEHADPFNIPRVPDRGDLSHFIHPVIRRFSGGELASEHHVPEDLENTWWDDMYVRPFEEFLRADLARVAEMAGVDALA